MDIFGKIAGRIKEEIQLTKEYYSGVNREQSEPDDSSGKNVLWPYDNKVNVKDLSRAEQHERELKIQTYMEAFPFLPFTVKDSRLYRPNTSWTQLNMTEQKVVALALQELDQMVVDYCRNDNVLLEFLPKGIHVPYNKIVFGFPSSMTADSMPRTFIEYRPFTSGGKHSKTPLIVHFTTIENYKKVLDDECHGELSYGLDGSVCHATANIFKNDQCYTYEFGVIGRTFAILKITTTAKATGKKIVIYSSNWEFILY